MGQTKQRQEGCKAPSAALIGFTLSTRARTQPFTHTRTTAAFTPHLHYPLHGYTLVCEGEEYVASEPSPLLSNDGLLPVQQIGLIAQKNLPTCGGGGG